MPAISQDYRGPLVVVAIGAGFLLVGAVPVVITYSIGVRTSAKIIGMGFIGFGLLLMLPGLCWCVWVRVQAFRKRHWPSKSAGNNASNSPDDAMGSMDGLKHDDDKAYRERVDSGARRSARTRSWPSTYIEPPTLIVADNEVCNAAVCVQRSTANVVNNGGVATTIPDEADQQRISASTDIADCSLSVTHPPPLITQRSDPGPTDRAPVYDHPRTTAPNADEAPP